MQLDICHFIYKYGILNHITYYAGPWFCHIHVRIQGDVYNLFSELKYFYRRNIEKIKLLENGQTMHKMQDE